MRARLLLPLLLAWVWACSRAFAAQAEVDERTLRAGGSELRISVAAPSHARAEMLHRWLAEAASTTLTVSGRFPLADAQVKVEEIDSRDPSPVPWGQTSRRDGVAVLLYVRKDATFEELRADWTAVHELAHLFHPYLGTRGRWLAEGLASYYQNVLRARAGLIDEAEAWQRLDAGFGRGRATTTDVRLDMLGRQRGGTMRIYWAGAAYWLEADLALRARDSDLDAVLAKYARCCLRGTASIAPEAFVAELDRVSGTRVFGELYQRYAAAREFPSLDAAYRQLGISAGNDRLRFSQETAAVRLRHAVLGRRSVGAADGQTSPL